MRIELAEPVAGDAERWLAWRGEAQAQLYNPLDDLDLEAVRARMAGASADLRLQAPEHRWMIVVDGERVGTVAVRIASRMAAAEIGYQLGERWHGRGIGTRAVALAIERVLAETGVERISATVAAENEASARLLRRLGFVQEGRFRQHWRLHGVRVDVLLFGLLRAEWRGP